MEGHMEVLRKPDGLPDPRGFRLAVLEKFRLKSFFAEDYCRYCLTWSSYEDKKGYAALLQVDPD